MQSQGWNFEHTYKNLPPLFYTAQKPATVPAPRMVVFNDSLARDLGLNADTLREASDIFAGNTLPHGAQPIAQAYAGYQFGHFAMLGDGRAVLLGEQTTPDGRKFDIQLKGSGRTAYSRGGDGLAALLPMLREYIISEAMHALGIPTTRSLAVVLTGAEVRREMILKGAVLTRVAASHIRVGTFNFATAYGTFEDLHALADYAINRHYPHLNDVENKYLLFFREVTRHQAALIAQWQLVGFVHGVMNTDNMAISGETIDYGPCAFMDAYDPDVVFSSIDTGGRYAYKNQPHMGGWNLARLAEALLPMINENPEKAVDLAKGELAAYAVHYQACWLNGMRGKLGLPDAQPGDAALITDLLDLMAMHKLDFTNTFRGLSHNEDIPQIASWQARWRTEISRRTNLNEAMTAMLARNPAVIPRNHRVEEALAAAESGDFDVMHKLLAALRNPYEDSPDYSQPPAAPTDYKTFCGT